MRILRIILYLFFILSPITSKAMDKDVITQQRGLVAKGDSCFNAYDYFHALQYYKQLDTTFVNITFPLLEIWQRYIIEQETTRLGLIRLSMSIRHNQTA